MDAVQATDRCNDLHQLASILSTAVAIAERNAKIGDAAGEEGARQTARSALGVIETHTKSLKEYFNA